MFGLEREARFYVDDQCIKYEKPLLESGTMGPAGNVDPVVPFKTQTCRGNTRFGPSEVSRRLVQSVPTCGCGSNCTPPGCEPWVLVRVSIYQYPCLTPSHVCHVWWHGHRHVRTAQVDYAVAMARANGLSWRWFWPLLALLSESHGTSNENSASNHSIPKAGLGGLLSDGRFRAMNFGPMLGFYLFHWNQ